MKKPDSHSRRLGPVCVFRAELDHVSALVAATGKVEYRLNGFIYDSLDELAGDLNGKPSRSIVIQPVSGEGAAAVSIAPHQVEVFALAGNTEPTERIAEYLGRHVCRVRPLWWRVLYESVVWLVAILVGAVVVAVSDVPLLARSLASGLIVLALAALLAGARRSPDESEVHLRERDVSSDDRKGLLFLVAALSGLVGLGLGIVLG